MNIRALALLLVSCRTFAAPIRAPEAAAGKMAPAAVPISELRPIDGAVGIGQGLSMRDAEFAALEPVAPYRDAVARAVADIGALAAEGGAEFSPSDQVQVNPEDRAAAGKIHERLRERLDRPDGTFGVFEAPISGREDFNLAFVDSARRIGASRQALESLKKYRKELAELLFHIGDLDIGPPESKFDRQLRYAKGGIQRRLFGAENTLAPILREVIDSRAADEGELGMRRGHIGERKIVRAALAAAFARQRMHAPYAEKAANTLARLQEGSLDKLGRWGVLDMEQVQALKGVKVPPDADGIARRIARLVSDYERSNFTGPQIIRLLNRMAPVALLLQVQKETLIGAASLSVIVTRHADFDSWIYRGQTLAARIANRVTGNSTAFSIIIEQGIDETPEWVDRAEPVVSRIQERVGGSRNAWAIVRIVGHEKAEDVVARAEPFVLGARAIRSRYDLALAWELAIMQGLKKYKR